MTYTTYLKKLFMFYVNSIKTITIGFIVQVSHFYIRTVGAHTLFNV
jgi:hypothetical protein